jgi:hypothetical protein
VERKGTTIVKVLFIGAMWRGSNALSLANGFAELGHDVRSVDTTPLWRPRRLSRDWFLNRLDPDDRTARALRLLATSRGLADSWRPDVQVCFKTIYLDQAQLLSLSPPVKISYSPDDVSNPENITDDYLRHESEWSMIVTTKRHNVDEIRARTGGRSAVTFVLSAYDPAWHHRCAYNSSHEPYDVGFVGHFRPDRAPLLELLAAQYGRQLGIFGKGWRRRALSSGGLMRASLHGPVYAECFSDAVARTWANLVLLNSANRDTHTCRTFEVPAAGGLFVGERTEEHSRLLDDQTEALFFSSPDELMAVLEDVMNDRARAGKIAEAGWLRIRSSNHRYRDRAAEILAAI